MRCPLAPAWRKRKPHPQHPRPWLQLPTPRRLPQHLLLQRWHRVQRHEFEAPLTRAANATYRPKPYPGHIVLFQLTPRPANEQTPPETRWRELALGGLEVVHLPGTHETLLSHPVAGPLVAASAAPRNNTGESTSPARNAPCTSVSWSTRRPK